MKLRIVVTQQDIAKARRYRWLPNPRFHSPIYHAIVRQTGYRHIDVGRHHLRLHIGDIQTHVLNTKDTGFFYTLPPEATQLLERFRQGKTLNGEMQPLAFDLELDARAVKLLCLNRSCLRCGDYPRESKSDLCAQCQHYRDTIKKSWR